MDSKTQANKQLVRNYIAAWDAGEPEEILPFFADDFSTSYVGWTGDVVKVEPGDVPEWIAGWLRVMDEMSHELQELVAEQDQVIAKVTYRAVHNGELFGIEPTGNSVAVQEFLHFRIKDEQIVEFDWLGDDLSLLRQLGVDLPLGG